MRAGVTGQSIAVVFLDGLDGIRLDAGPIERVDEALFGLAAFGRLKTSWTID